VIELQQLDILCFQETHLNINQSEYVMKRLAQSQFTSRFGEVDDGRGGVGFAVRKRVGDIVSSEFDPDGHWGFASIRLNCGRTLNILNLYCPQNVDQQPFWVEIEALLESLPEDLVMLGDFNNRVEQCDLAPNAAFSATDLQCKQMLDSFGFDDIRLRDPEGRQPTYFGSSRVRVVSLPIFEWVLELECHLSDDDAMMIPRSRHWKMKCLESLDQSVLRFNNEGAAAVRSAVRDHLNSHWKSGVTSMPCGCRRQLSSLD
jgi:hypothetical protein